MSDVPDLSSGSDDEHFEEEEWQEMETSDTAVKCLFCNNTLPCIEEALPHVEREHHLNLSTLKCKFNMDCYSYIKLINFIRDQKPTSEVIMNMEKAAWDDDKYLKPVVNDEWLMFDFDSLEKPGSPKYYLANVENGVVTLSQSHFTELHATIQNLTDQLSESQSHLQMAREDIKKMQESMKNLLTDGTPEDDSIVINDVSKIPLGDDDGYFGSYAHFGIHHDMLSDKVRTESYRQAIIQNAETMKDKVVLDLGCGTGILSMFTAKAGAKKVFALDMSDIVYHAMDIIRENNLQDTIKVIKGKLEKTNLEEKVDVIVSEWMGYFLLFEGMLDSVIYARDNCLKPGGLLLPNRCNISLVANGDVETHNRLINFWSDVYGFKMNCMKSEVTKEASIDVVNQEYVLSEPVVINDIDINTCTTDVMDFSSLFKLPVIKGGKLTSFVCYFDTFFELPNSVSFSTGPHATPTHWKQTVFYLKDPVDVNQGDIIEGKLVCNRQKTDVRGLTVTISVFGKNHRYILS